jgi:hypothetical protein
MYNKVKSFILQLPEDKRLAFDDMLRRNGYGGYEEALEWLKFYNVTSSRSAISRYSTGLRKRDGVMEGAAGGHHIRFQSLELKRIRENDCEWMKRIELKLDRLLELLEKD